MPDTLKEGHAQMVRLGFYGERERLRERIAGVAPWFRVAPESRPGDVVGG